MAQVDIDTTAVTQTAAKVRTAPSSTSASSGVTVLAPAADPVSVAVSETLQARCAAITGYSSLAEAITQARGTMLASSAGTYEDQERISAATLANGGSPGAGGASPPAAPAIPTPTIPTVSAPQIGAPPTNGKDIATLMHGGPGPSGLYAAAQQLRSHASQLSSAARQLRAGSAELSGDWQSSAGDQASARIRELGQWYERHAEHATSAAGALESHAETYARAKANTPTPQQFQDTENRLKQAATANANPANMGRYAPVVSALQTELSGLHLKATTQYADYAASAGNPSLIGDPMEAPPQPGGGTQALDAPLAPAPKDDPQKYWLDLSKIVQKAPGELGPNGYMELTPGSGVWYPDPAIDGLHPGQFPSGPAKAPVDLDDIKQYAPGDLGPNGYQELIPDSGTWVPQPGRFPGVEDAPPQTPIDVRKLIQVPEGTLAPANTVQIAPGLWYPESPGPR